MASWIAAAQRGLLQHKSFDNAVGSEEGVAIVEGCQGCSERDVVARLSSYGTVAWCNRLDVSRCLVRFLEQESLQAASAAINGSNPPDGTFRVSPCLVGQLLPGLQESAAARSDSIPAILPEQLAYLNRLMSDEPNLQQNQQAANTSDPASFPELQPCNAEWTRATSQDLLMPLEDEALSSDEVSSITGGSAASTSQLWSQRSIGAVARKDLAKFAALQSLAQQHSNSSTPGPGLMQAGSGGISSPWGSFTAGSGNLENAIGIVRRVSSPAGHSASVTPPSNYGSFTGTCGLASALGDSANGQQMQFRAGMNPWGGSPAQLPADLDSRETGSISSRNGGGICSEDTAAMLRLQQVLLEQQQQQQQQQLIGTADPVPALLSAGLLGSTGLAGELLGRGVVDNSGSDIYGLLGLAGSMAVGPAPPPPPPPAQLGPLGGPPPPPPARFDGHYPPGSSDGRLSGATSPVPAPPPRALTPGAGGSNWASPMGSPRFTAPQTQSPSAGFRGQPRGSGVRVFQPGMSNLGYNTSGAPGLVHQHSYDQLSSLPGHVAAQQSVYRVSSPVRGLAGMPPPPPPGLPHPAYAAAAAAAAAGGVSGSPIPPGSPASSRVGDHASFPIPGMMSAPAGLSESFASTVHAPQASQSSVASGTCVNGQVASASVSIVMKADGALFVQELLQLLRSGLAANSTFLSNLRDLLECALAGTDSLPDTAANGASQSSNKQAGAIDAVEAGSSKQQALPVDAVSFLGMLQEAAAPLVAAAAASSAAVVATTRSNAGHHGSHRGSQRASDSSSEEDAATLADAVLLHAGRGLKPIRTSVAGQPGGSTITDLDSTSPAVLLRHLSRVAGSPLFYPLHPRTTTSGASGSSSSAGCTAPGTPLGTPMLLVPQTLPELLSARAALVRLMVSAHTFVSGPAYGDMAFKLDGVAAIYDSMHDDPVVVKRRKCKEIACIREAVKQDQAFSEAVATVTSLRNHIYSLSRKVLIGYGHVEGLPTDLLLGGLTSELAAILSDPSGLPQQGSLAFSSGAATSSSGADNGPQSCLPQAAGNFFTSALPLPKLALLVFAEFVPVDPSPIGALAAPASTAIASSSADSDAGSPGGDSSAGNHSSSTFSHRPSNLRDRRSGPNSTAGINNHSSSSSDSQGSRHTGNRSRNGSFSSQDGSSDAKQRMTRRSQQPEFDLAAEAKVLEAAASAAAPLVAAAVCDLPAGRRHRRGSDPEA